MRTTTFAIVMAAAILSGCGGSVPSDIRKAAKSPNGSVILTNENRQATAAGAAVIGRHAVSRDQLDLVDAGLLGAFNDARSSGYDRKLTAAFFEIFTPPEKCQLSPVNRTPSFLVHADEYDGTEFDQYNSKGSGVKDSIGVVFAAEMVISIGTEGSTITIGQMYVCPDAADLANAVRYGAEHIIIANNDAAYFWETVYHGNGFYHPLLPKRNAFSAGRDQSGRSQPVAGMVSPYRPMIRPVK